MSTKKKKNQKHKKKTAIKPRAKLEIELEPHATLAVTDGRRTSAANGAPRVRINDQLGRSWKDADIAVRMQASQVGIVAVLVRASIGILLLIALGAVIRNDTRTIGSVLAIVGPVITGSLGWGIGRRSRE